MPILTYRCPNGHTTDDLHRSNVLVGDAWVPNPVREVLTCRCGGEAKRVPSAPSVRVERGAHYDVSMGRWFRNQSEADAEARRLGLSERTTASDIDSMTAWAAQQRAEFDKGEAEFAETQKEWREAPYFAWHRENIDKGVYVDDAKRRAEEAGVVVPKDKIIIEGGI